MITVHGFPVIAIAHLPNREGMRPNMAVILVDRGADHGSGQRYVTANYVVGEDSWSIGHYITTLEDAISDFTARWQRKVLP